MTCSRKFGSTAHVEQSHGPAIEAEAPESGATTLGRRAPFECGETELAARLRFHQAKSALAPRLRSEGRRVCTVCAKVAKRHEATKRASKNYIDISIT